MTGKKKILGILIAFLVAVSFAPITGQAAFADEEQVAFDASGQVTGLVQSSATYKSATIKWAAYSGAEGYEVYRASSADGTFKLVKTLTGRTFKDTGNKTLGKTRYYIVRAYATVDSEVVRTMDSEILAAKPKLSKPSTITSAGGLNKVTIKWSKVSGATGYKVYRATSQSGTYKKMKTTTSRSYTNTSVTNGKKYFYKVRAYRKVSGKAKYGGATSPIEGMSKLRGPVGFKAAIADDGTVVCSWNKLAGATKYKVQRALQSDGTYTTIATTSATQCVDIPAESGNYCYRIRAFSMVNGDRQYGYFSGGGRSDAVSQARSWLGAKESNGSHKKIIDVYNGYNPASGKIGYSTSWCAAFVSAVAIKTNNTDVIPVHSYCPTMLSKFKSKSYNKSYTPKGGDVVFYDWNWNRVPDHVGMIEEVSGSSVTAIEGNCSDMVKRRTFKKGYSLLLAYGLPYYSTSNMVTYTAPEEDEEDAILSEASVTTDDIVQACEEITETETVTEESLAETVAEEEPAEAVTEEAPAETEMTETETAEMIMEYIQEENPAAGEPVEESTYNAFLVYGICDEMDIDASVVTLTDGNGTERSYNEVVLDGELYIMNTTEDGGVLEKFTPEEIN